MIAVAKKDYKTPFVQINKGEKYNVTEQGFFKLDGDDCDEELDGSLKHKTYLYRLYVDEGIICKHFLLIKEDYEDIFQDFRQEKLERILKK